MASISDNHAKAPIAAAFVQQFREVFGDEVEVWHVNENGLIKGEKTPDGAPCFHMAKAED